MLLTASSCVPLPWGLIWKPQGAVLSPSQAFCPFSTQALLILVLPGFLRHALRSEVTLPVTDTNGQYIAGGGAAAGAQPYAPAYQGPAISPNYK